MVIEFRRMNFQQDTTYKVVTIGAESVGKTSMTTRFIYNIFNQHQPSTVGANYQVFTRDIDGERVNIQIWDTAGQEKFKSLSPIYFRNSSAAIVVFSLTSRSSFRDLEEWIAFFLQHAGAHAKVFVAGNKSDLMEEYEVVPDEARAWAEANGYAFFLTSAKTGDGVEELFSHVAVDLAKTKAKTTVKMKPSEEKDRCC